MPVPPSKRASVAEPEGVTAETVARSVWLGDGRSDGSVRRQWRRLDRELGAGELGFRGSGRAGE